jgi:hypothetical protein
MTITQAAFLVEQGNKSHNIATNPGGSKSGLHLVYLWDHHSDREALGMEIFAAATSRLQGRDALHYSPRSDLA